MCAYCYNNQFFFAATGQIIESKIALYQNYKTPNRLPKKNDSPFKRSRPSRGQSNASKFHTFTFCPTTAASLR